MTHTYAGQSYSNGKVPAAVLGELNPRGCHGTDGKQRAQLRADAAASWNRAIADVKARTGLTLTVRGWNRTLAEQEKFFLRAYTPQATGGTDPRVWKGVRYVRRSGHAAAAIPGRSNHGWGLAVDVTDFGAAGQWNNPRRAKAYPILAEHGWTDTEGRQPHVNEPWHLVYDPTRDQHRTQQPTPPPPAQGTDRDDEELLIMAGYPHMLRGTDNDTWTVVLSPTKRYDVVLPPAGDERTKMRKGLVALYGEPQTIGDENARRARATVG